MGKRPQSGGDLPDIPSRCEGPQRAQLEHLLEEAVMAIKEERASHRLLLAARKNADARVNAYIEVWMEASGQLKFDFEE